MGLAMLRDGCFDRIFAFALLEKLAETLVMLCKVDFISVRIGLICLIWFLR